MGGGVNFRTALTERLNIFKPTVHQVSKNLIYVQHFALYRYVATAVINFGKQIYLKKHISILFPRLIS